MVKRIKFILFFLVFILLNSCILENIADNKIIFDFVYDSDNRKKNLIINKDTLMISKLEFVLTNLRISTDNNIIEKSYPRIISPSKNNAYNFSSIFGPINISFNLGVKDINKTHSQLDNQGYNIENGYYFIKVEGYNKTTKREFKFHVAKKNLKNDELKSVLISLDGYGPGGIFFNYAYVDLNLNSLFTSPNLINIDDLNDNVTDNIELQIKMIENTKNAFSLNRFESD